MRSLRFKRVFWALIIAFIMVATSFAVILEGGISRFPENNTVVSPPSDKTLSAAYPDTDWIEVKTFNSSFESNQTANGDYVGEDAGYGGDMQNTPTVYNHTAKTIDISTEKEFLWMIHNSVENTTMNKGGANATFRDGSVRNVWEYTFVLKADFRITASEWIKNYGTNTFMSILDGNNHYIMIDATMMGGDGAGNNNVAAVAGVFFGSNRGTIKNLNYIFANTSTVKSNWKNANFKYGAFIGVNYGKVDACNFYLDGRLVDYSSASEKANNRSSNVQMGTFGYTEAGSSITNCYFDFKGIFFNDGNVGYMGIIFGACSSTAPTITNVVINCDPNASFETSAGGTNNYGLVAGELKSATKVNFIMRNGREPSLYNQGAISTRMAGTDTAHYITRNVINIIGYSDKALSGLSVNLDTSGNAEFIYDSEYISKIETSDETNSSTDMTLKKITFNSSASGVMASFICMKDYNEGSNVIIRDSASWGRFANIVTDGMNHTDNLYYGYLNSAVNALVRPANGSDTLMISNADFSSISSGMSITVPTTSGPASKISEYRGTFDFNNKKLEISGAVESRAEQKGVFGRIVDANIINCAGISASFAYGGSLLTVGTAHFGFFVAEAISSTIVNCKNVNASGSYSFDQPYAIDSSRNLDVFKMTVGLIGNIEGTTISGCDFFSDATINMDVKSTGAGGQANSGGTIVTGMIASMTGSTITDTNFRGKITSKIYGHHVFSAGFSGRTEGENYITDVDFAVAVSSDLTCWGTRISGGIFGKAGLRNTSGHAINITRSNLALTSYSFVAGNPSLDAGAAHAYGGLVGLLEGGLKLDQVAFDERSGATVFDGHAAGSGVLIGYLPANTQMPSRIALTDFWLARNEGANELYCGTGSDSGSSVFNQTNRFYNIDQSQGYVQAVFGAKGTNGAGIDGNMYLKARPVKSPLFDNDSRADANAKSNTGFLQGDKTSFDSSVGRIIKVVKDTSIAPDDDKYYTNTDYYFDTTGVTNWEAYSYFMYKEIRDAGEWNAFATALRKENANMERIRAILYPNTDGVLQSSSGNMLSIGSSANPFKGQLDGNNVILNVNNIAENGKGLFGGIANTGVVKNMKVNFNGLLTALDEEKGKDIYAGIVAGYNLGLIDNVDVVMGAGATVKTLNSATGSNLNILGGYAGYNSGTIKNSSIKINGLVTATSGGEFAGTSNVGGFVGRSGGNAVYENIVVDLANKKDLLGIQATGGRQTGAFIASAVGNISLSNIGVSVPADTIYTADQAGTSSSKMKGMAFIASAETTVDKCDSVWVAVAEKGYFTLAPSGVLANMTINKITVRAEAGASFIPSVSVSMIDNSATGGLTNQIRFTAATAKEFTVVGWYTTNTDRPQEGDLIPSSDGGNGIYYEPKFTVKSADYSAFSIGTQIQDGDRLKSIASYVSRGVDFAGVTFSLIDNITVSTMRPIGTNANPFRGAINGGGRTVNILSWDTSGSIDVYGLIGAMEAFPVTEGGVTYSNTGIYNINVAVSGTIGSGGDLVSAALVGINRGGNIGSYNEVTNGVLYNRMGAVNITANSANVSIYSAASNGNSGFIVGHNTNFVKDGITYVGNVKNVVANVGVNVTINGGNAGVFAGQNDGIISYALANMKNVTFSSTGVNKAGIVGYNTSGASLDNIILNANSNLPNGYYAIGMNESYNAMSNVWVILNKGVGARNVDATRLAKGADAIASATNGDINLLYIAGLTTGEYTLTSTLASGNFTIKVDLGVSGYDFYGFYNEVEGKLNSNQNYMPNGVTGYRGAAIFAQLTISTADDMNKINEYVSSFGSKEVLSVKFNLVADIVLPNSFTSIRNFPCEFSSLQGNKVVTTNANPVFGTITAKGKVSGVTFETQVSNTPDNLNIIAKTNSGVIQNVVVNVNSAINANRVNGFVEINEGEIKFSTFNANSNITANQISGFALTNSGKIVSSNANFASNAIMGMNGSTRGMVSGIAYTNAANGLIQSNNVKVESTFSGENVETYFSGVTYNNKAVVDANNVVFNAAGAVVDYFAGVAYTNDGSIVKGKVSVLSTFTANKSFAGIAGVLSADKSIDGTIVAFGNSSQKIVVAGVGSTFAGAVGTSYNASTISNVQVNLSANLTVSAPQIAGLVGNSMSTINSSVVNAKAYLDNTGTGSDAYTAGLVAKHSGGSVKNSIVALVSSVSSTQKNMVGSVFGSATGSDFAINTWVVYSNKYHYPVVVGGNRSGVNTVAVIDNSTNYSGSVDSNGVVTVKYNSNSATAAHKWYANVNERIEFAGGNGISVSNSGKVYQVASDQSAMNNNITLSFYDLDIDGYRAGVLMGTTEQDALNAEFAEFANYHDEDLFGEVLFKLFGDVYLNSSNFIKPIASEYNPFNAIFDGQGYQINLAAQLMIERVGLFDTIGEKGVVKNFVLNILSSQGGASSTIVGGLASVIDGTVDSVAVVLENRENEVDRIKFSGATNAIVGTFAGIVGNSAVVINSWTVATFINDYKPIGNPENSAYPNRGVNSVGIYGTQKVNASMASVDDKYSITFTSTADSYNGWYSDFDSNQLLGGAVEDVDTVSLTVANNYRNEKFVVSYFKTEIYNVDDLKSLAHFVNMFDVAGKMFELKADIVINDEFTPIGINDTKAFNATFSGGGHKITFSKTSSIVGAYAGLFGVVGSLGMISNLEVVVETDQVGGASSSQIGIVAANCQGELNNIFVQLNVLPSIIAAGDSGITFGGVVATYGSEKSATNVWLLTNDDRATACPNTIIAKKMNIINVQRTAALNNSTERFATLDDATGSSLELTVSGDKFFGVIDLSTFSQLTKPVGVNTFKYSIPTDNAFGKEYSIVFANTEIHSAEEFDAFVAQMQSPTDLNIVGIEYTLYLDVVYNSFANSKGNYTKGIGDMENPFKGIFNGNGHSITMVSDISADHIGLFGATGANAIIKNLSVDATGSITGSVSAGILVGYNEGKIENVVVKENFANGKTIVGTRANRIVGRNANNAAISNVWVILKNSSSVAENIANANLHRNGLNILIVIGTDFADINGKYNVAADKFDFTSVAGNYWYTDMSQKITAQTSEFSPQNNLDSKAHYVSSTSLSISSKDDFNNMQKFVASTDDLSGVVFTLFEDLTFDDGLVPVGSREQQFLSIFDGNGKTITLNQDIIVSSATGDAYAGIFGYVGSKAAIKNVAFVLNSHLSATTTVAKGKAYTGAIAYNGGSLSGIVVIAGDTLMLTTEGPEQFRGTMVGFSNEVKNSWVVVNTSNPLPITGTQVTVGINTLTGVNKGVDLISYAFESGSIVFTIDRGGIDYGSTIGFYSNYNSGEKVSNSFATDDGNVYKLSGLGTLKNVKYQAVAVKHNIESVDDLNMIARDVNAGYTFAFENEFTVANSITLNATFKESIGDIKRSGVGFAGKINAGSNKLIINTTTPLFANILEGAQIKNWKIEVNTSLDYVAIPQFIASASFALINRGTISGCDFTVANNGNISSADNIAGFIALNKGSILNSNITIDGVIQGKNVAGFVYANEGKLINDSKSYMVYINGTLKAPLGDVAGVVYNSLPGSAIELMRVWFGATNNNENVVLDSFKVEARNFAGVVYDNGASIDTLEFRYYSANNSVVVASNNIAGAIMNNVGSVKNIAGTIDRELNAKVFQAVGKVVLDGNNTGFVNSWIASYTNDDGNSNYEKPINAESNWVKVVGKGSITIKLLENKLLTITPTANTGDGYTFNGWYNELDGSLVTSGVDPGGVLTTSNVKLSIYELVFVKTIMSSQEDLQALANDVNRGVVLSDLITLGANITISGAFTAIGTARHPFSSQFDGKGFTITFAGNAVVNNDHSGLFGYIGTFANIKNINVTVASGAKIGGSTANYSGAFAGYNAGQISNTTVTVAGSIEAKKFAGGVLGANSGALSNVNFTLSGQVKSAENAGGVIGFNTINTGGNGVAGINAFISGTVVATNIAAGVIGINEADVASFTVRITGVLQATHISSIIGQHTGTLSGAIVYAKNIAKAISQPTNMSVLQNVKVATTSKDFMQDNSGANVIRIDRVDADSANDLVTLSLDNNDVTININNLSANNFFMLYEFDKNGVLQGNVADFNGAMISFGTTNSRKIELKDTTSIASEYDLKFIAQYINNNNAFISNANLIVELADDIVLTDHTEFALALALDGKGKFIRTATPLFSSNNKRIANLVIDFFGSGNDVGNILSANNNAMIINAVIRLNITASSYKTNDDVVASGSGTLQNVELVVFRDSDVSTTLATKQVAGKGNLKITIANGSISYTQLPDEGSVFIGTENKNADKLIIYYFINSAINTAEDFALLNESLKGTNVVYVPTEINLMADITVTTGLTNALPKEITFNGNGYKISLDSGVLFSSINNNGGVSVKNLVTTAPIFVTGGDGNISNIIVLGNGQIAEAAFSGGMNNVWLIGDSVTENTGYNAMSANAKYISYEFNQDGSILFTANRNALATDGKVFSGFAQIGVAIQSDFTADALAKGIFITLNTVNSTIMTTGDFKALVTASNNNVLNGTDVFSLGADITIDINNIVQIADFKAVLDGKGFSLNFDNYNKVLFAKNSGTVKNTVLKGSFIGVTNFIANNAGTYVNVWASGLIVNDANVNTVTNSIVGVNISSTSQNGVIRFEVANYSSGIVLVKDKDKYLNAEYAAYSANGNEIGMKIVFESTTAIGNTYEFTAFTNALNANKLVKGLAITLGANIVVEDGAKVASNNTKFDAKGFSITTNRELFSGMTVEAGVKNAYVILTSTSVANVIGGNVGSVETIVLDVQTIVANNVGIFANTVTTSHIIYSDGVVSAKTGVNTVQITNGNYANGVNNVKYVFDNVNFSLTKVDLSSRAFVSYFKDAAQVLTEDIKLVPGSNYEVRYVNNNVGDVTSYNALVDQINGFNKNIDVNLTSNIAETGTELLTLTDYKGSFNGRGFMIELSSPRTLISGLQGSVSNLIVSSEAQQNSIVTSTSKTLFTGANNASNVWLLTRNVNYKAGINASTMLIDFGTVTGNVGITVSSTNNKFMLSANIASDSNAKIVRWFSDRASAEFKDELTYTLLPTGTYDNAFVEFKAAAIVAIDKGDYNILIRNNATKVYDGTSNVDAVASFDTSKYSDLDPASAQVQLRASSPNAGENVRVDIVHNGSGRVYFTSRNGQTEYYINVTDFDLRINIVKRKIVPNFGIEGADIKVPYVENKSKSMSAITFDQMDIDASSKSVLNNVISSNGWRKAFIGEFEVVDSKGVNFTFSRPNVGLYNIYKGSFKLNSTYIQNFEIDWSAFDMINNIDPINIIVYLSGSATIEDTKIKYATNIHTSELTKYFNLSSALDSDSINQIKRVLQVDVIEFMTNKNNFWSIFNDPDYTSNKIYKVKELNDNNGNSLLRQMTGFEEVIINEGAVQVTKEVLWITSVSNNNATYWIDKDPVSKIRLKYVINNSARFEVNSVVENVLNTTPSVGNYEISVTVKDKYSVASGGGLADISKYIDIKWGNGSDDDIKKYSNLTINPCEVVVRFVPATKEYGAPNPTYIKKFFNKNTGREILSLPPELSVLGSPIYYIDDNNTVLGDKDAPVGKTYTLVENPADKIRFNEHDMTKNFTLSVDMTNATLVVMKAIGNIAIKDQEAVYGEKLHVLTVDDFILTTGAENEVRPWDGKVVPQLKYYDANGNLIRLDAEGNFLDGFIKAGGDYFINGVFEHENYTLRVKLGKLTIKQREVTVNINTDVTKGYAQNYNANDFDIKVGGADMAAGEIYEDLVLEFGWTEALGVQDIVLIAYDNDNYKVTNMGQTLAKMNIVKAVITITVTGSKKEKGSEDPEIAYSIEGMILDGDLIGRVWREEGESTGTYTLSDNFAWDATKYDIKVVYAEGATFEITNEAEKALMATIGEAALFAGGAIVLIIIATIIFIKRKPRRMEVRNAIKNGEPIPPSKRELKKMDKKADKEGGDFSDDGAGDHIDSEDSEDFDNEDMDDVVVDDNE